MDAQSALRMIQQGSKLAFVRCLGGSLFLVNLPFELQKTREGWRPVAGSLTGECGIIPSWKWDGDLKGYRVHYLDLPLLEALAFKAGYTLEYENRDALRKLRSEYLERREWKKKVVLEIPLKRPMDPLQTIGSQFMYRTGWALNADGMGGGKTVQGIGAVVLNKMDGKPHRTLVLCPKSVKGAWAKEIRATTDMTVVLLESNMEKRFEQYATLKDYDFVISSFDSFVSDFKEIGEAMKPDILIIDEVHRICERGNRLTQILIGGREVKKTFFEYANPHSGYLMTGTPISNDLEDLYALLRLMDRNAMNWIGFRNRYCITEEGELWTRPKAEELAAALANGAAAPKAKKKTYTTVVGYQNQEELKAKLSLHMIRRTKDELLPNLPKKTFTVVEVELDAEERKVYNALKDEFTTTIRGKELTVKSQLEWMTRAQQICDSLEIVPDSTAKKSTKLVKLLDIIKAEAPHRKIVVFSKYKEMTDIIVRELKAMRIPSLYLHGDVKDELRQPMCDEFQEDDTIRVFVSTMKAGGVGITLHAAGLCVLYDRWWSPGANFQAVDRLHRRGLKHPVDAVFLRVKDSVEEYVEKTWVDKQDTVNNMISDEAVLSSLTATERVSLLV
jgi:SNF2 family DNA or RNA helicase